MSAGPHVTQDWIVGLTVTSEPVAEDSEQPPSIPQLEEAAASDPTDLETLKALAEAYRISGDFDAALEAWEKVLAVNPTYQRGLSRLVAVGARGSMDWPRIWRAVRELEPLKKGSSPYRNPTLRRQLDALFAGDHLTGPQPSVEEAASIVETLEEMGQNGRHLKPTTVTLVLMCLQFAGHFSLGFRLRMLSQQRRIAQSFMRPPGENLSALRNLLKALVYTSSPETAAQLSRMQHWTKDDPQAQRRLQKMHADALLMAGRAEPYCAYAEAVREQAPLPGEDRMSELVTGKRVAVVGPADTGDRLGELIDSYDVVVRPRYQPDFLAAHPETMGSRTDIAYYSGFDMDEFLTQAEEAVDRGDLQLVNARPFTHATHAHLGHRWLRFYRQDYSLCPAGGQLGIQRMTYDLLQFRPAEIAIFNSDFYTGSQMFTAGWRPQDRFGPGSHINDIVAAHDIRFDFAFTQALMKTGTVTAQGQAAEVLAMSVSEYEAAVEAAGVLR